jgi:phosphoribosylanthranilate isomerase
MDMHSGVESGSGRKSGEKVAAFVREAWAGFGLYDSSK